MVIDRTRMPREEWALLWIAALAAAFLFIVLVSFGSMYQMADTAHQGATANEQLMAPNIDTR